MPERPKPVTVRIEATRWRARAAAFPGNHVRIAVDATIAGADLYGGLITLDPGATVELHWHRRGEIQYILRGQGRLLHPDGRESAVAAGSAVFSPPGAAGAHGFRNSGRRVLEILFFYGAPGGRRPSMTLLARNGRTAIAKRRQP
jgi:oxalate decarboxylase/phosphoglucose isomerase-like protein (cupin superfamily)